jgi:hypothetical protein
MTDINHAAPRDLPPQAIGVFSVFALATVLLISHLLGRDLNWDFINYHFYGPHLMLEGRLAQDYFAGSFQSYLNPLSHVPQYLMIQAGWSAMAVSATLAAFHSLNLLFIGLIARQLLPQGAPIHTLLILAIVLALQAPLFITTVGSSFADPTTSVLVLAALFLLVRSFSRPTTPDYAVVVTAGLLLGLASGLKFTNGVLAVGIMIPTGLYWIVNAVRSGQPLGDAMARIAAVTAAGSLGFVIAHGYWSWQLWTTFGNPFFPLFNSVFQSPDFPATTYRDTRFLGPGSMGLLLLPFQMIAPTSWLYAENAPVDLRFAAFVVLVLIGLVVFMLHRRAVGPRWATESSIEMRPLLMLTAIFTSTYLLWGTTTRIGRYALPLWMLLGPLLVAWFAWLLRSRQHLVVLGCAVLISAQSYALIEAGNPRWSPTKWESAWFEARVPDEMRQQPHTVLTLGNLSFAAIVPFLHPDSRVVNLIGQHIQGAGPRQSARLTELLAVPDASLRVVFKDHAMQLPYQPELTKSRREDVSALLSMYGLSLASGACEPIRMPARYFVPDGVDAAAKARQVGEERLHACPVQRTEAAEHARVLAERDRIAIAFDNVERACGAALNPHGTELLRGRQGWMRSYFNSLHSLNTDGSAVWVRPFRSTVDVHMGSLRGWQEGGYQTCPPLPAAIMRLD